MSRLWHWDEYRTKASQEPPVMFMCATDCSNSNTTESSLDYIKSGDILSWARKVSARGAEDPRFTVNIILSFFKELHPPFSPCLSPEILAHLARVVGAPSILQHQYVSKLAGINHRFQDEGSNPVFVCSSGTIGIYTGFVVLKYNVTTDDILGYIVCDLGAFDHHALLGVPSQTQLQPHPLLILVLFLERVLEVLMSDLEFYTRATVAEAVLLSRKYADKVPEYHAWFCGWMARMSTIKKMALYVSKQLDEAPEWLPAPRVEQYSRTTEQLRLRLQLALESIELADEWGNSIYKRLEAWRSAAFRKVAQEDADVTKRIAEYTLKDGSTMKLLAFLGTVFLPATFVSTFFSMPVFNWEVTPSTGFVKQGFWLWWAVMIPMSLVTIVVTYLWIRLRIGRRNKGFIVS